MLTNTSLEDAVLDSLGRDPRIPDSADIAVAADGGLVTLRGTVENFSQRRAATVDAKKIDGADDDVASLYGVYGVTNEIKVNEP